MVCGLSEALDDIERLIDAGASDPEMTLRLNDLYESIENIDENASAEEVGSSTGLAKLKRFLNESAEAGSAANEFLKKVSNGVDIAKGLAKKYNSIAEWCGAPQVPEVLIK